MVDNLTSRDKMKQISQSLIDSNNILAQRLLDANDMLAQKEARIRYLENEIQRLLKILIEVKKLVSSEVGL